MSSSEHELKIKASTEGLKEATKEVEKFAKAANKANKTSTSQATRSSRQQKEQIKGLRDQSKFTDSKVLRDQNREIDKKNKLLAQQNKLIQQQTQLLQQQNRASNGGAGGGKGGGKGGGGGHFGKGFAHGMGWGKGNKGPLSYRLGAGLAGATRGAIGLAGMGLASLAYAPISAIATDYQAYFTNQRNMGRLAGLAQGAPFGAGLTMAGVKGSQSGMAKYGFSPEETISAYESLSRATGTGRYTEQGMKLSKGLGLDVSQIGDLMGAIRQGAGGFGSGQMSETRKVLQAAVKAGVDASTLPEYLSGIESLTKNAAGRMGGGVSATPYAQLLGLFGKSGQAGLKGERGAGVLSALEGMITHPGGGEEGNAVMMAAMGFGGAGNKSYYQAKKAMEQGFSGPGGSGTLKSVLDYVDRVYGGGEQSNLAIEQMTGGRLTLDQIESVRKAFGEGKSQEDIDSMLKDMTATELDVLKHMDGEMSKFITAAARSAHLQLESIDRGAENAGAIEHMEDTLQKLITDTNHILAEYLPKLADIYDVVVTAFGGTVQAAAHPVETARGALASIGDARDSMMRAAQLDKAADSLSALTDDESQERALAATITAAHAHLEATGGIENQFIEGGASIVNGITGSDQGSPFRLPTSSDRESQAVQADLIRAVNILSAWAESHGIDTTRQQIQERATSMEAVIQVARTFGMNVPTTDRGTVDSSGGLD